MLASLGCLFQQHDNNFALLLMGGNYTEWEPPPAQEHVPTTHRALWAAG